MGNIVETRVIYPPIKPTQSGLLCPLKFLSNYLGRSGLKKYIFVSFVLGKKALSTVNFSQLHHNVFERECEAISGNFGVSARRCFKLSMFKYIVITEMR